MDNQQKLIELLTGQPGEYISGEEISRRLSISRTAVWKQINRLRENGYEFEAVSRKGYRLLRKPDKLNYAKLLQAIQIDNRTERFGSQIKLLDTTLSTQEEVRKLAEHGVPEGALVIAEEQTSGRGRHGREWYSPAGKGIWMSFLLRPELPLSSAPQLTLLTAVAVCRAIRKVTNVMAGIKWPNDILVNDRKCCGILLESAGEDELIKYCIAGIGIDVNLTEQDIPEYLQDVATSLQIESKQVVDRHALIGAVLAEFEQLYELYKQEGFSKIGHLWEALSVTIGRQVMVRTLQGEVTGVASGLESSGALTIKDEHGKFFTIFSGEVQLG